MFDLLKSSVGKKVVMAVTGLILVGFVISHMTGNLKVFGGVDSFTGEYKIDLYALFLRTIGEEMVGYEGVLWLTRIVLLLSVILHAWAGITLARLNRASKPVGYRAQKFSGATAASRTMIYGGLLLIAFIFIHILHLTTGELHPGGFEHLAVYSNLYSGFEPWYFAVFYVVAMAALALHIYHGIWSMFQTLGVDHPSWNGGIRAFAKFVSVALFIGFSSVPVAMHLRLVSPPQQLEEQVVDVQSESQQVVQAQ